MQINVSVSMFVIYRVLVVLDTMGFWRSWCFGRGTARQPICYTPKCSKLPVIHIYVINSFRAVICICCNFQILSTNYQYDFEVLSDVFFTLRHTPEFLLIGLSKQLAQILT